VPAPLLGVRDSVHLRMREERRISCLPRQQRDTIVVVMQERTKTAHGREKNREMVTWFFLVDDDEEASVV